VVYILIALALAISLVIVAAPTKVDADPGTTKWTKVTTPSETNITIDQCSDIYDFAVGSDGETVYAIGDDDGDIQLWKSVDGGATWKDLSSKLAQANVKLSLPEEFYVLSQIAVAPDNKDFVVVAGYDDDSDPFVVGSTNGGTTFYYTGTAALMGSNELIVSMDVSAGVEDVYNIALGTDYGKVWRYEAGTYWGSTWVDATATATYPGWVASSLVSSVAFSPNWAADKTVLAISTDWSKTYLQSGKWATAKGWGSGVERASAVEIKVDTTSITPRSHSLCLPTMYHGVTGIALPSDYTGYEAALRIVYLYVDTNSPATDGGYLFRVDSTTLSTPCGPTGNPWLGSIAYHGTSEAGDAMLGLLGDGAPSSPTWTSCCSGVQVYRTDEIDLCCPQWSKASKPPSGRAYAVVAFTPDGGKAYATTEDCMCEGESAFSVSLDKGKCWNQLGLIDTHIDYLSDVAVSPDCSVTYLSSINDGWGCDCDSVWMKDTKATAYAGVWQRVYHKSLDGNWGLLRLSPEHDDGDVVYWGDWGTENLYWAKSKGICAWSSRMTTINIQDFALADDDTVYVIESTGGIVKWVEAKHDWTSEVDTKCATPHTIAVLGDWILVGGSASKVTYSSDGAGTFTALDDAVSGDVHIAFDSYFEDNDTIYYASTAGAIKRWVIGTSTAWTDLKADSALAYYGIVLDNADGNPKTSATTGGVLYASYVRTSGDSGVARVLTPAATPCCGSEVWDYLEAGLGTDEWFDAEPSSLKICGCLTADSNTQLFAIDNEDYQKSDGKDGTVWTYEDCFSKAGVTLKSVADGAVVASDPCYCCNEKFVLSWDRLCNACDYDVKIYLDEGLTQLYTSWTSYDPPDNASPTLVVDQCELDCDTEYWWTVTAVEAETGETIHSWASGKWSFTVEAGPGSAIQLISPDDGATNVAKTNIGFTWSTVPDATSYDWVLSANADLSSPVESKTGLTGTAYIFTGTLNNNATYFWQVTAKKDANVFSQSEVSTFSTAPAPVPPPVIPEPPAPTTPAWVWVVIGIGAVLVIVVIVLIFRTRRV
jgi:hypothetical protein